MGLIRLVDLIQLVVAWWDDDGTLDGTEKTLISAFESILRFIILVFGILALAEAFDFNLTTIIAGLGVGGLALAFAAKDTIGNLFGAVTLLLDRPFKMGDWIKVGGSEGEVIEVGIRTTLIRTSIDTVVTLPNASLVNKEIENFGVTPIKAYRARDSWHGKLSDQLIRPNWSEDDPILCVVATFATFSGDAFQNLLSMFPRKSMFIADEVHHLGSETLHSRLPISKCPMRMALSATPRRWQDREGTERIYEWFGPETLKPVITVGNAIERGALCPYMYYPRFIHLQEAESGLADWTAPVPQDNE